MAEHDSGYRLIFSHPRMVQDLLRGVSAAGWLARADFATLRQASGSRVSGDLRDRHADAVWCLRWLRPSGEWADGYLLLEFQSTPYQYMAVRMTTYLGLLYEDLIRKRQLASDGCLPPVLLVVLYNGGRQWAGPRSLSRLIAWPGGAPQVRYRLVDLRGGHLGLSRTRSPVLALLADIESLVEPVEFPHLVRRLAAQLPGEPELRRDLTTWLAARWRRDFPGVLLPPTDDLEEIAMHTEMTWAELGRASVMKEVLLRQMERRFGPVSPDVRQKLARIFSLRRLEKLTDKVLVANSPQEMGLG